MIKFCIIHYNTPRLTECLVKSIKKFTPDSTVYIFDNSDTQPFTYREEGIVYINNTDGRFINFDKWLLNYPKRNMSPGRLNKWGSAKHSISVEKCMDIIGDSFILLDSDILFKKDVSPIWNEEMAYVGEVVNQPKSKIKRVLPYMCFINVKMLKKNGVHYFDDSRMHGLRCTKKRADADSYDTGAPLYYDCIKLPTKQIKLDDYIVHYNGGSWAKEKEIKYKHTYTPEQWLLNYKEMWKKETKNVVYTCITGKYDGLLTNIKVSDNFDYVCFTDNVEALEGNGVWEIRPIPSEVKNYSPVKQQRYVKICAHKVLPEYDNSIWVDANVSINGSVDGFVNKQCSGDSVCYIPKHPSRECLYKEGDVCVRSKKDTADNINPQMSRYRKEGYPERNGLVQTNIMFRKHNDPSCIKLMETWWGELSKGSHRDQLSFNYALWKNKDVKFTYLDKTTCNSVYFHWNKFHGKRGEQLAKPAKPAIQTTPITEKNEIEAKETEQTPSLDMVLDNSTLTAAEFKPKVKYKPMLKVASKHPRTKSMKSLLSIF